MMVFMDTEYTAFNGPRLISLALVAEDGQSELYVERSDYPAESCSSFVRDQVIPLLELPPSQRLNHDGVRKRLISFLQGLPFQVQIACDDAQDGILLRDALGKNPPQNVVPVFYNLREMINAPVFRRSQKAYHDQPGCPWHHALHDARALRLGWLAWHAGNG
jgi:hypothetical protein